MSRYFYFLFLFFALPVYADVAVEGTAVTTSDYISSADSSFVTDLPTGATAGELIFITSYMNEQNKDLTAAGWTVIEVTTTTGTLGSIGYAWREVTGGNASDTTVTFTINSGSSLFKSTAVRLSGVNITSLNASQNWTDGDVGSSLTSFNIPANTLTSVDPGSAIALHIASEANRDVSSADGDLVTLDESASSGISLHSYVDEVAGGTGNPQYDFTMSDSRHYVYALLEIPASGGSSSIAPIADYHARRRRQ